MLSLRFSYGLIMFSLWPSHGSRWFDYGFCMVSSWFSHVSPIVSFGYLYIW